LTHSPDGRSFNLCTKLLTKAGIGLLSARKTAWELESKLHKIDRQVRSVAQLEQERDAAARFDVAGSYAGVEGQLNDILSRADYSALLRVYNNKGLGAEISSFFGTHNYPNFVKRLVSNGQGDHIIAAMRAAAPVLPVVVIP